MSTVLRIGTRGSQLARWQTDWVRERLARHAVQTEVVVITTQGDADVDRPLHELEGTRVGRVSTREPTLEDAYVDLVSAP